MTSSKSKSKMRWLSRKKKKNGEVDFKKIKRGYSTTEDDQVSDSDERNQQSSQSSQSLSTPSSSSSRRKKGNRSRSGSRSRNQVGKAHDQRIFVGDRVMFYVYVVLDDIISKRSQTRYTHITNTTHTTRTPIHISRIYFR